MFYLIWNFFTCLFTHVDMYATLYFIVINKLLYFGGHSCTKQKHLKLFIMISYLWLVFICCFENLVIYFLNWLRETLIHHFTSLIKNKNLYLRKSDDSVINKICYSTCSSNYNIWTILLILINLFLFTCSPYKNLT